ncbi:MAG: hypothetical protein F4175_08590 [Gemmatimonadetes bacterium]|nr:hypothetical protein [Gemmatimonadota bacterium]
MSSVFRTMTRLPSISMIVTGVSLVKYSPSVDTLMRRPSNTPVPPGRRSVNAIPDVPKRSL